MNAIQRLLPKFNQVVLVPKPNQSVTFLNFTHVFIITMTAKVANHDDERLCPFLRVRHSSNGVN